VSQPKVTLIGRRTVKVWREKKRVLSAKHRAKRGQPWRVESQRRGAGKVHRTGSNCRREPRTKASENMKTEFGNNRGESPANRGGRENCAVRHPGETTFR